MLNGNWCGIESGYQSWDIGESNERNKECYGGVISDASWIQAKVVFRWSFEAM